MPCKYLIYTKSKNKYKKHKEKFVGLKNNCKFASY